MLSNMNIYSVLVVSIISIAGVVIAMLIIKVLKGLLGKIKNAKIPGVELKFNGDIKSCNLQPFALIFRESLRVGREIDRIDFQERLREQMNYVEDEIIEIKELIVKIHRHILQAKGISKSDSEIHPQIKILSEIVENMLKDMKGIVRDKFKEMYDLFNIEENVNNDYNFIRDDFEKYLNRVIENIMQESRANIRKRWVDHKEIAIGRRESWESIIKTMKNNDKSNICILVREMFINAIKVQLKYSKRIKALEFKIDEIIQGISNE